MPAGSAVRLHAQKYTMKKSRVEIVFGRLTWMAQAQRQSACRGSTILQAKKVATTTNVDPVRRCNTRVILKPFSRKTITLFVGNKVCQCCSCDSHGSLRGFAAACYRR